MKSGFVAIIGKPNAGKSTLLNTLVGEKVSIVSWRPQTTRNKITGILHGEDFQIVFTDTPGLLNGTTGLAKYMIESISGATKDVDAIVYVVDGEKHMPQEELAIIEKYRKRATVIVAVNKTDVANRGVLLETLGKLNTIKDLTVVPLSAKKSDNIDVLIKELLPLLSDGIAFYPEDMVTDKPLRFMVAEIIREKSLKFLQEEIPHGIGIEINKYEVRDDGLNYVEASIICEKETHKSIIIGKGGGMIKKIATAARKEAEELVGDRVFMKLWVKVKSGWKDNNRLLINLGYDPKDLKD